MCILYHLGEFFVLDTVLVFCGILVSAKCLFTCLEEATFQKGSNIALQNMTKAVMSCRAEGRASRFCLIDEN